jgi:predicted dehydrogenase
VHLPEKIRVAVIGVGAFGRNHARVYADLAKTSAVEFVGVVDSNTTRATSIAAEFGVRSFPSLAALLEKSKLQAASVAVPTEAHARVGCELMEAGVDVLIEKPLAPTLDEAEQLMQSARRHGRIAQAGHLERFNPAVRAAAGLLNHPMFFEVHRLSVFTPRSLDVDVVLDLMIHDLDIVLAFADSGVKEIRAVGLPILTPKVDIANVRIEFDSGCVANFTASRVSTEQVRKLRFFQPRQYISLDFTRQDAVIFTVPPGDAKPGSREHSSSPASEHPSGAGIKVSKPEITKQEPLRAEICAFLEASRRRSQPLVSLEQARRALAVGLEILAKIQEHSRRLKLTF